MSENVIEISGLKKSFGKDDTLVNVLTGVELTIEKGKMTAIVGPSGSGKSTLLHLIGALDKMDEGSIKVDGKDIGKMSEKELNLYRRQQVGFVFQAYNLIPELSVYENMVLPILLDRKKVDTEYMNDIIKALGIEDKLKKYPNELSGGQKQRVAIARALANRPSIILCDEPTGNLDKKNSDEVMKLLKQFKEKYNQTILIVTHDMNIANDSDCTIEISSGKAIKKVEIQSPFARK